MSTNAMIKAVVQASTLSSMSNVLAQFLEAYQEQRPFQFDFIEFLRFVICAVVTAPPNFYWQGFLERTFPSHATTNRPSLARRGEIELAELGQKSRSQQQKPRLNIQNTLSKWFIDCITVGALVNTVAFLSIIGLLKGMDYGELTHKVRRETLPLIVTGYRVWPIASLISFSFIPWERRIVFFSSIGLFWGIYLSLISARL